MDSELSLQGSGYLIGFVLEPLATGANVGIAKLSLSGSITVRDPGELNAFFDQVHQKLLSQGAREVAVDVRGLTFINSTGFKPIIYWVGLVTEADEAVQYQVRVVGSGKQRWQASFLSALSCFAPELVQVDTDPER